jgi:hypothetical protein
MPVNASVHQPGLASRRTSVALASVGVRLLSFINAKEQEVRGIEISANHLSIH